MYQREDGSVRTDAEGDRQNHRESEYRGFAKLAEGESDVVHDLSECRGIYNAIKPEPDICLCVIVMRRR